MNNLIIEYNHNIDFCKLCDNINVNINIIKHCQLCNICHYKHNIYCKYCNTCYNITYNNDKEIIKHKKKCIYYSKIINNK